MPQPYAFTYPGRVGSSDGGVAPWSATSTAAVHSQARCFACRVEGVGDEHQVGAALEVGGDARWRRDLHCPSSLIALPGDLAFGELQRLPDLGQEILRCRRTVDFCMYFRASNRRIHVLYEGNASRGRQL